jgi:hypothetical protein
MNNMVRERAPGVNQGKITPGVNLYDVSIDNVVRARNPTRIGGLENHRERSPAASSISLRTAGGEPPCPTWAIPDQPEFRSG